MKGKREESLGCSKSSLNNSSVKNELWKNEGGIKRNLEQERNFVNYFFKGCHLIVKLASKKDIIISVFNHIVVLMLG